MVYRKDLVLEVAVEGAGEAKDYHREQIQTNTTVRPPTWHFFLIHLSHHPLALAGEAASVIAPLKMPETPWAAGRREWGKCQRRMARLKCALSVLRL